MSNIRRFSNPSLPQKVKVTLVRDGFNQPWGFRLAGGTDLGLPLTIIRALAGTPAEGELRPGDVISKIGDHDARHLTHQDAQNLFKNAGNNIAVVVQRGGAPKPSSAPMSPPLPPSVATLPRPPVAGGVATPFAAALAQRAANPAPMSPPAPSAPALSPPQPAPVYNSAPAPQQVPSYAPLQVQTTPAPSLPEFTSPVLPEFITHSPVLPARGPNSLNSLLSPNSYNSPPLPNNNNYSKTLLTPVQNLPVTVFPPPLPGFTPNSGLPRRPLTPTPYQHEYVDDPECIDQQPYRTTPLVLPGAKTKREVPITSYLRHHPNPSVRAPPHHFDPQVDVLMKQKVVHQFNSPIGLYSDQNIAETVQSQTGVTPYKGRKTLYYDPAKSETYKALQDSELGGTMMEIPEPIQPKVFTPHKHIQPPLNQMQRPQAPRSPQPNHMNQLGDDKIHQSYTFRRLMNEVLGESEF